MPKPPVVVRILPKILIVVKILRDGCRGLDISVVEKPYEVEKQQEALA